MTPEDRSSGTATVLFTDLVGSTELMSRLGDVAYDELRGAHFAGLREALSAHHGKEIKNTGDGLLVTFGAAADAVRAAVAVQQATDRHARAAGQALAVRVGIALGDVTFDDGDVFGTPVVEAARLVAAARPEQILATAVVRVVAGSRAGTTFADLGPLDLKGLREPVPVCEVAWVPLADAPAAAVPLPSLLARAGRIFVGREEELERLRQRWKEAAAGERRLVLLGGEPGIGKTRLATEMAQGLHADGHLVLAGRCDEDLGVPYQPFVEALRHYVSHADQPRLGRHGGELARLVPELPQLVAGLAEPLRSDPDTERYRLFDAVTAWLGDVSEEAPVLLVLDDLHWAAKPTLLLLRHILRSEVRLRLLFVATYRDSDIGRGHPLTELLADVSRLDMAERVPVTGLDVPAVAAFVDRAAGHDVGEEGSELARAVWRETEGNAFFVSEVIRHLVESGAVVERDGRWEVTAAIEALGIPQGVRDVVGRRLCRLSEETNRVLACASVVGLEFEPAVLQRAGGFTEDAVIAALEESVASRLVVEVPGAVPRNRFGHALVRATLYDELSGPRRVVLHRRVAESIEAVYGHRLDDHLPALAHHWAQAAAPAAEVDRAVEYATRAGDRALGQLAHDEAASYYRQALELLETTGTGGGDGRRLELLISLGVAQRRAADPRHRGTLLDAGRLAQARGDPPAMARAALANSRGFLMSVVGAADHERIVALKAALDALSPEDSELRARLLAHLAIEQVYLGDWDTRAALSNEALAMARRLGDAATLADVLLSRFYAIMAPSTLAERAANTAELIGLAAEIADQAMVCQASWQRMRTAFEAGDLSEAHRCLEVQQQLSAELGEPSLRLLAALSRAGPALLAGRIDEAEHAALAAFALAQSVDAANAELYLLSQLVHIRFDQGRFGELTDMFRPIVDNPALPSCGRAAMALALCESGRPAEARQFFEPLAASGFADLSFDNLWLWGMGICASTCAALGDADAARIVHSRLVPYADQFATVMTMVAGSVSHHLGVLATVFGDFDEAQRRFTGADAAHARVQAPGWLARTRLEWARMLIRRGDPGDVERAMQLAGEALATAEELGMAGVAARAGEVLGST